MALMTVRTAAGRMGVGYSTLKQWILRARFARPRRPAVTIACRTRRSIACWPATRRRAKSRGDSGGHAGLIVALSGRNQLRGFVEEVRD